jgi:hypothetical protein
MNRKQRRAAAKRNRSKMINSKSPLSQKELAEIFGEGQLIEELFIPKDGGKPSRIIHNT